MSASQYEGAQTKIEALEKTVVKYKEQIQLLDKKLTIFQQNNSVLFSFSSSHNPPSSPSSTPNINQIFHDNLNLLSKCYDELLAAQSHFHVCFFSSDPCSLVPYVRYTLSCRSFFAFVFFLNKQTKKQTFI